MDVEQFKSLPYVELHSAYLWDCDECGAENIARAVKVPIDQNDPRRAAKFREMMDIPEWQDLPEGLYALGVPSMVRCKACGVVGRTVQVEQADGLADDELEDLEDE